MEDMRGTVTVNRMCSLGRNGSLMGQWQTRHSQQHSGYARLRPPRWPGRRHGDSRCLKTPDVRQ